MGASTPGPLHTFLRMPMKSLKPICAALLAVVSMGSSVAIAQSSTPPPALNAAQKTILSNAVSCIRGAVETAYVLSPEKLTGDSVKDTRVIADASNKVCITGDLIDGFGGAQAKTTQDKEKALLETMKWYGFTTESLIKQRAQVMQRAKGK